MQRDSCRWVVWHLASQHQSGCVTDRSHCRSQPYSHHSGSQSERLSMRPTTRTDMRFAHLSKDALGGTEKFLAVSMPPQAVPLPAPCDADGSFVDAEHSERGRNEILSVKRHSSSDRVHCGRRGGGSNESSPRVDGFGSQRVDATSNFVSSPPLSPRSPKQSPRHALGQAPSAEENLPIQTI